MRCRWNHPDQNRTEKALRHFRSPQKDFIFLLALAASLVLAQMPAGSLQAASVGGGCGGAGNSSILQGMTNNLAAYNPIHVTWDHACQYVRATRTSRIVASDSKSLRGG
jgi:hypothetical protein